MLRSVCRLSRQAWIGWQRSLAMAVEIPPLEQREFAADSKRTGVIAIKAGMTQDWDDNNAFVPLTVLWIDNCQVIEVSPKENGNFRLQLGCGFKKEKNTPRHVQQEFYQLGVPIKSQTANFIVSADGVLPVGTSITAAHFVPGQYIDVKGTTIGKGFQGVMKRWGFAGGPASHGSSKFHRSGGSIGACQIYDFDTTLRQDPGKVWKGKKMAGHMGCKTRVVHNVWVYKVDPLRNLIYVRGQVPGHKGNYVYLRDALYKEKNPNAPFPTHIGVLPEIGVAEPDRDPYHLYQKGKV